MYTQFNPIIKRFVFLLKNKYRDSSCAAGNPGPSLDRHKACDDVKPIKDIPTIALLITRSPTHNAYICCCHLNETVNVVKGLMVIPNLYICFNFIT